MKKIIPFMILLYAPTGLLSQGEPAEPVSPPPPSEVKPVSAQKKKPYTNLESIGGRILGKDVIQEDYHEGDGFFFHTDGTLSYGSHTNTFHLRETYLRANYNYKQIGVFTTVRAFRDTHDATTTYGYVENNISLYDYGFIYRFENGIFLSLRGAATYLKDSRRLVPMHNRRLRDNPAGFDTPRIYNRDYLNGPGMRFGWENKKFGIGYSQADRRHSVPKNLWLRWAAFKNFEWRAVGTWFNKDPSTFNRDDETVGGSTSLVYVWSNFKLFGLRMTPQSLGEVGGDVKDKLQLRLEQGLDIAGWMLAARFILSQDDLTVVEGSLTYNMDLAEIGFMGASDERFYLISRILF